MRQLYLASIVAYVVALALPAYPGIFKSSDTFTGWECLIHGWRIAWFWAANPLLFISWPLVYLGNRSSIATSVAALVCCLFAVGPFPWQPIVQSTTREGVTETWSSHLPVGGYLWLGSMILTLIASFTTLPRFNKPLAQELSKA
jgi:hypothetical protein